MALFSNTDSRLRISAGARGPIHVPKVATRVRVAFRARRCSLSLMAGSPPCISVPRVDGELGLDIGLECPSKYAACKAQPFLVPKTLEQRE
jgi:hypothetical protein